MDNTNDDDRASAAQTVVDAGNTNGILSHKDDGEAVIGNGHLRHDVSDPQSDDLGPFVQEEEIDSSHRCVTAKTNGNAPGRADVDTDTQSNTTNSNPTINRRASTSAAHKDRPISGVVPPYWRHQRALSRASLASSVDTHLSSSKPAITLEDHTADPNASTTRGLWARNVTIDDHVVVSGKTGIGAYVVWMCNVQTLDGGSMTIPMRYSEFDDLRLLLAKAFPYATNALPPLPPKSVLFKFRPKFLESRRIGLQYFLNCVLLNPDFAGSPVLKDFLFSRVN